MGILENNICALLAKLIDYLGYCLLISRNRIRGEDNRISLTDRNLLMHATCHTAECSHTLTLASGCDDNRLIPWIILQLLDINQCVLRNINTVQVGSGLYDIHHTSSFHDYFPAKLICRVNNLLYTVNIGCKGCNNDSRLFMFFKQRIKHTAKCSL